jgi:cell division cycle protein 20 (cofactor of APC complex)
MNSPVVNAFDAPLQSAIVPRWKRKALEKCDSNTPTKNIKTPSKTNDRFIPNRSAMDLEVSAFNLEENAASEMCDVEYSDEYDKSLNQTLLGSDPAEAAKTSQVLAFRKKAPTPADGHQNNMRVLYTANRDAPAKKVKSTRYISQTPERILDAPDLLDDYYLNLLDWSQRNVLAISLGATVYLWNASDGSITQLCELEETNCVTSVQWGANGAYLAVGTDDACVQLWDVEAQKQVRNMQGHEARVGALAWNNHILSSGSRDTTIIHHDVRVAEHRVATLANHEQEVCGLKWSPNGMQLASGGNDNRVNIWNVDAMGNSPPPQHTFNAHQAAVKALAWCPWQENCLASGGGTADRTIRFWNTQTGSCLNTVDTKSQVCSLVWSPHERELLSSHGFSQNQLTVWKFPQMTKVTELTGHTSRVLHTALSADGTTVVSAAADETLRFWKVFGTDSKPSKKGANNSDVVGTNAPRMSIR